MRQHERVGLDRGRYDSLFVLGIQQPDHFFGDAERLGHLIQMQMAVDHDRVGRQRNRRIVWRDTVVRVIMVQIGHGDQRRDVIPCRLRQVRVNVPVGRGLSAGSLQCLDYVAGTVVVRREGERPVVEHVVQVFQIAAGGLRRSDRVASGVYHRRDFEPVITACHERELPQTYGTGRRCSGRLQRRFDYGQEFEFQRQSVFLQFPFEDREIIPAVGQHAPRKRLVGRRVGGDLFANDFVVRKMDRRDDRLEPLTADRFCDGRESRQKARRVEPDEIAGIIVERLGYGVGFPAGDDRVVTCRCRPDVQFLPCVGRICDGNRPQTAEHAEKEGQRFRFHSESES